MSHKIMIKMKKSCLMILIVLILMANVNAQEIPIAAQQAETIKEQETEAIKAQTAEAVVEKKMAVDLIEGNTGYATVLYDNTNGLPTSEANAIAETSEGFIWIGCYSGLVRYDGNTFERIDSTTGITSVVRLYVDSKDRLWIGTNDNGVAVNDQGTYIRYNLDDGLKSSSIRAIVEDSVGNIYIATTQGIAYVDSDMVLHAIEEPRINEVYVRQLQSGNHDEIYGLTMDGSFFILKNGELVRYFTTTDLGISDIRAILPDKDNDGYFYFGTKESGIYYGTLNSNLKNAKVIDVAPLESINCVEVYDNQLWVCADNGIGIVTEGSFQKLENIPFDNSIERMMMDYQGNLWFTSSRQGIMKIVPSRFMDMFERYDLKEEVINTTCMYRDQLFVGKDRGLVVLGKTGIVESIPLAKAVTASGKELEVTDLVEMLDGCKIRSIIRDSKDRIWISAFGKNGLIRYDGEGIMCFTQEDGMPSDRVRTVYECEDGSMAVACTGGVAVIQQDQIIRVYDETIGIKNPELLTVTEARNHDLIVGTDGGGIYVIREDKATLIDQKDGLSSGIVMRIKKDTKRNLFWIVTSNAIAYMNEDYTVTTIQKFPYSNNFDLYENSKGEMWVLSSNGIYVLPVENLLENEKIEPVLYNMDNGLPSNATANSYSELTQEGNLYIAGKAGVVMVNIDENFENVNNIKIAVPFVEADGKMIYPSDSGAFIIPASVDKITIYSYVYTYSLSNPQVTYYLKGFDKSKKTVARNELLPMDYTNLRGGRYRFVIQLKDVDGQSSNELSILIVKQKKIHEVWWFNVLGMILAAVVLEESVRLHMRRKMRAVQRKQEEQRKLINEITEAFAKTIDMKDKYTNGHSFRVAEYTVMLAKELGYDEEALEKYHNIALLHDIGKIGVPSAVLNKDGKLTDEEFGIIKSHAELGYDVLKDISIMPELAIGAGAHHERPDGKGYPRGLKGEEIPRVAQIIAVADTFDAMYSNRPYRGRMNFDKVVSIIKEASGTQLASDVVDAFLRLAERGVLRAPDDNGGGSSEDINNIGKAPTNGV